MVSRTKSSRILDLTLKMLTPLMLESVGAQLDFINVTELQAELFAPWDQVEAPTSMFERQDKIEKQLVKAGIPAQAELRLALASGKDMVIALANWTLCPQQTEHCRHFES